VKELEGDALGGRVAAKLWIDKAPAGAEVAVTLRLTGGSLPALAPGAAGSVNATLDVSGRGSSPVNAIAALRGSGSLELSGARLAGPWPGAVGAGIEAALKADPEKLGSALQQTLVEKLTAGELPLGSATLPVEVADGQLKLKPLAIDTADGRASGAVSVDLKTLALDSEWRLEQKPVVGAAKPALPAVTVAYRGPLAAIGKIAPRIASDALERELAVRRMERDVEELERLRKLDEARRRDEAERLRLQLERAPTPAPVPLAPAGSGPRPATPG
jgi:hypothetical protein